MSVHLLRITECRELIVLGRMDRGMKRRLTNRLFIDSFSNFVYLPIERLCVFRFLTSQPHSIQKDRHVDEMCRHG